MIEIKKKKLIHAMAGLYIHIPFCRSKCLYCDFYSGGSRIADWNSYVEALLLELKLRRKEFSEPFDTLYIGGGTPSLMPEENLSEKINFRLHRRRQVGGIYN